METSIKEPEKEAIEPAEENVFPEMELDAESKTLTVTDKSHDARMEAFAKIFGTRNENFQDGSLSNLISLTTFGDKWSKETMKYAMSFICQIEPRDTIESNLASQMYTVHREIMTLSKRMSNADTLEKYEVYSKAHARLTRIYTNQMEALRKYRNGGEQKVTVQHVNVNSGGQAVVGNIEAGGGKEKNET